MDLRRVVPWTTRLEREEARTTWLWRWIDNLQRDVRHTARALWRSPGFTLAVTLTLALGIGATTAMVTLIQQVMLRPLAVVRPDQLWRVGDAVRCCHWKGYAQNNWSFFSGEAYRHFRANTSSFEQLAALQVGVAELGVRRAGSSGALETLNGEYVSGNFFATFGISAWRGRVFTDADDQDGAAPVAVMSFHTWKARYGSEPSVIGAPYLLNGHPFTIIGIAPPSFFGAKVAGSGMPDLWLPLATEPSIAGGTSRLNDSRVAWLDLIGRVRPGTSPHALEAQLQAELQQWLGSHEGDMLPQEKAVLGQQTLHLTAGGAGVSLLRESYEDELRLLLLAALCVLLLASANVANLLLARGIKDRHQTTLRAALGASRARLIAKALVESLTLSVLGGIAGIAVAYAGVTLILQLAFTSPDSWVPVSATPSVPVLLFALAISVITGVVFGTAPAWVTSRASMEGLRGGSRSLLGQRHWSQKALVSLQAALSLVLLSAAAMLGQSVRNLERQDFGFDPEGRHLVSINAMLGPHRPEQMAALVRDIETRVRAIPGVRMASPALYAPLSGYSWSHDVQVEHAPDPGPEDDVTVDWTRVAPGFFETLGNRIVAGRPITDEDGASARRVAVINQSFARKFFGRRNPIGQHFGPAPRKNAGLYEIVGVAADLRYSGWELGPMYFVPEAQTTHFDETDLQSREVWSHYPYSIVIWAPGNPPGLAGQVKAALAAVDPDLVVYDVRPYSQIIHETFAQENLIATLTSLFGAVGLALAAVGLYGVTAYGVEQRTGEIGVRMALGANRGSVVVMVLREAFWQVGLGLLIGIPAAIAAGYLITSQLFGVVPWDPMMLAGASLLLALATLVAAVIPARRAAGVDPMQALRSE
jgi:predicted permease